MDDSSNLAKFGDDNGSVLVTNLTYATFVSMFPLLLILVTFLLVVTATDLSFPQRGVPRPAGSPPG